MSEKGSSTKGGNRIVNRGNGDFNLPGFVGRPNAPQRLELQHLLDQQESEREKLEARNERERIVSQLDEPDQQRRREEQQNESLQLRERHQGEQRRLGQHQRRRSHDHPRFEYPWPVLKAAYHIPPPLPADPTAEASSSTSPTTRATTTQTEDDEPEDGYKEEELEQIVAEIRRERQSEVVPFWDSLPSIRTMSVNPEDGGDVPLLKLPKQPFPPQTAEDRRAGPSHWSPHVELPSLDSFHVAAPSRDEWERPWPNNAWAPNGRPRLGPGDILPLPVTTGTLDRRSLRPRREVKKSVENRYPQPTAQPMHSRDLAIQAPSSTTDSRQDDGRTVNNGGHAPYPMSYEEIQEYYFPHHPRAAASMDRIIDQPPPQPTRGYGMDYPYGRPDNADNDDRHMSGYYSYNSPYSSPYAGAVHYDPPRNGHRDGLAMLSDAAAEQSSVPPQSQHGYYHPDREYDAAAPGYGSDHHHSGHGSQSNYADLFNSTRERMVAVAGAATDAAAAAAPTATTAMATPPSSSPWWTASASHQPRQRPQWDSPSSPAAEELRSSIPDLPPLPYLGQGPAPAPAPASASASAFAPTSTSGFASSLSPPSRARRAQTVDSLDNDGDTVIVEQEQHDEDETEDED